MFNNRTCSYGLCLVQRWWGIRNMIM